MTRSELVATPCSSCGSVRTRQVAESLIGQLLLWWRRHEAAIPSSFQAEIVFEAADISDALDQAESAVVQQVLVRTLPAMQSSESA